MSSGEQGVALPYGFGDSITSVHLIQALNASHVFNASYRRVYTEDLLDLIQPVLGFKRHQVEIDFESRYRPQEVMAELRRLTPYRVHDLKSVKVDRCFDFRQLIRSRPDLPGRYAVVSGATLGRDRVLAPEVWGKVSRSIARAGVTPVLIGQDTPFRTTTFTYQYEADGIDLRNCLSLQETINTLAHSEACFCTANAVSVLAHELGCRTLCVGAWRARKAYLDRYFTGPAEMRINYNPSEYFTEAEVAVRDWLKNKRTELSTGGLLRLQ